MSFLGCQVCGFAANEETGKQEKALYYTKRPTVRLNAIPGKQRLIESFDPIKKLPNILSQMNSLGNLPK
jgi:hypothetical protein